MRDLGSLGATVGCPPPSSYPHTVSLSVLWVWGQVQESAGGIFLRGCILPDWGNESVNNLVLYWSFSVCLFADSWDVCPKWWLYPYRQVLCVLMRCGAPSNLCWVCFPLNTHVWALLLSCARMFVFMLLTLHHMYAINLCDLICCSHGSEGFQKYCF